MKIVLAIAALIIVIFLVQRFTAGRGNAEENIRMGEAFLAKNAENPEIKTTESGLQYQVITSGTGSVHPKATDKVTVHYHGTLIDGTVFDSSVQRGESIAFGLNQVIKGWTEGLQLMVVGEKTRLFIPSELAYGNRSTGAIGGGSTLIFEVELLGIND